MATMSAFMIAGLHCLLPAATPGPGALSGNIDDVFNRHRNAVKRAAPYSPSHLIPAGVGLQRGDVARIVNEMRHEQITLVGGLADVMQFVEQFDELGLLLLVQAAVNAVFDDLKPR